MEVPKKVEEAQRLGHMTIQSEGWYFDVGCRNADDCYNNVQYTAGPLSIGGVGCAWEMSESECTSKENNRQIWERQWEKSVVDKLIGTAARFWGSPWSDSSNEIMMNALCKNSIFTNFTCHTNKNQLQREQGPAVKPKETEPRQRGRKQQRK
mmetsp:Transcript_29457/g.48976  ORF Transcript_29457/g.48976 Transcript_29457/m.48976 type:complete len:152 (-) Transcript_29457:223-678(-)